WGHGGDLGDRGGKALRQDAPRLGHGPWHDQQEEPGLLGQSGAPLFDRLAPQRPGEVSQAPDTGRLATAARQRGGRSESAPARPAHVPARPQPAPPPQGTSHPPAAITAALRRLEEAPAAHRPGTVEKPRQDAGSLGTPQGQVSESRLLAATAEL